MLLSLDFTLASHFSTEASRDSAVQSEHDLSLPKYSRWPHLCSNHIISERFTDFPNHFSSGPCPYLTLTYWKHLWSWQFMPFSFNLNYWLNCWSYLVNLPLPLGRNLSGGKCSDKTLKMAHLYGENFSWVIDLFFLSFFNLHFQSLQSSLASHLGFSDIFVSSLRKSRHLQFM